MWNRSWERLRKWVVRVNRSVARNEQLLRSQREAQLFLEEFWCAHADWRAAKEKLHYSVDKDEQECAIYLFEAKQKRLEMLIRVAKSKQIYAMKYYR